jgi:hypothetical protein
MLAQTPKFMKMAYGTPPSGCCGQPANRMQGYEASARDCESCSALYVRKWLDSDEISHLPVRQL